MGQNPPANNGEMEDATFYTIGSGFVLDISEDGAEEILPENGANDSLAVGTRHLSSGPSEENNYHSPAGLSTGQNMAVAPEQSTVTTVMSEEDITVGETKPMFMQKENTVRLCIRIGIIYYKVRIK